MKFISYAHPVLSCQEAKALESSILADEAAEWTAMKMAGQGIAQQLVQDYAELCPPPEYLRILALIGKGNNGGDALIACAQLLADFPRARVDLILTLPAKELSLLAVRALKQLEGRVETHQVSEQNDVSEITQMLVNINGINGFHICIDGLLGMAFSPPLRAPYSSLIESVNSFEAINLRASVDLPSGKGDGVKNEAICFKADFTYATGIAKKPIFEGIADCGRIRYIDLGFFEVSQAKSIGTKERI